MGHTPHMAPDYDKNVCQTMNKIADFKHCVSNLADNFFG